ncbi:MULTISPECIES: inorganic pyrophosphatase [Methylomonas]|uniref:inorganic diphosphatase n=1 Tax=Methylomonas koyamae TaxID=702114 RepID=A0A177NAP5_9GAMM|nr:MULTISPECIES: inorganic pyrophosphatase [Methylomonas]NJA07083.1 inorganic pyrophosphatase [Methylococcaceae bacterium WWC4]OAI14269.1 inorganic pyrophosphatase [Methylomonas koyamae]OHX38376.1 inorganic pyrophosphatase [Methylomonas sp. LWB]WGS87129.1 inorganic pyrophosphatase [Methylomonas sp. UP202]
MNILHKAHPWHGIAPGDSAPDIVTAFIEIVPSDTVKYEIDKHSGYLKIDRPQKFSNMIPTLYGFIPRTYCAEKIAEYAAAQSGRPVSKGDGDPLDICVLSERSVTHGDILLQAIPIGGFRLLDGGEADDKIIAVMKGDEFYRQWRDVSDCPESYINRLKHYFLTYKHLPSEKSVCEITHVYGRQEAHEVIKRSMADYQYHFGCQDDG